MKIIPILIIIILTSCSKLNNAPNTALNITGTWRLTDSYDNYKNNTFQWNVVPDSTVILMQLTTDNNYILKKNGTISYAAKYTYAKQVITLLQQDNTVGMQYNIIGYSTNNTLQVSFTSNGNMYQQKLIRY